MSGGAIRRQVGTVRPSQLLTTFGVGAVVDLPHLSVCVMGLDDWPVDQLAVITEERLLAALQSLLGVQVQRLCAAPIPSTDSGAPGGSGDDGALLGVPVVAFPRWVRCSQCRLLAPVDCGLFSLHSPPYRPEETRYVHRNCIKSRRKPPTAIPARFIVACPAGHIDDFPWVEFVHKGSECKYSLRMDEVGTSGEASDVQVTCVACDRRRRMAEAFGDEADTALPSCRGHRFHLRDQESRPCQEKLRTVLLGASNAWFPVIFSALSVPTAHDKLGHLVEDHWSLLENANGPEVLTAILDALQKTGQLSAFKAFEPGAIWMALERHRARLASEGASEPASLRGPEWKVFSAPDPSHNSANFRLRGAEPPARFADLIEKVVLAERLREVRALIGFTRIESPGNLGDRDTTSAERRAPICRKKPTWVPACEVRGEGIFLQLRESALAEWMRVAARRDEEFRTVYRRWRRARALDPPDAGYPTLRYVLLHSFSHALIRQFALECGYTAASIRERIYSLAPEEEGGPMAGILLYTAAPDSEGTLGGLVSLGQPGSLQRHLDQALERMTLCASDPLCAEHRPGDGHEDIHGASCHACLFASETSCERGNRFLDRSVLVPTVQFTEFAFFAHREDGGR